MSDDQASLVNQTTSVVAGNGGGQASPDTHKIDAASDEYEHGDQLKHDTQNELVAVEEEGGQKGPVTLHVHASLLLSELKETHREREDFHRAEKSLTLQIKARIRRRWGVKPPEAKRIYKAMIGKGDDPRGELARAMNSRFLAARDMLEAERKLHQKRICELTRLLPVWAWAEQIRGLGALGLGQLIAEIGDLSNYPHWYHVNKRMGVAVIGEDRQRRIKGDAALEHGYSPSRRAILWNVGESLIKQNQNGPYRTYYIAEKERQREKMPDASDAHINNRAKRHMTKRLLKDLWQAWREATTILEPIRPVPPAVKTKQPLDTELPVAA